MQLFSTASSKYLSRVAQSTPRWGTSAVIAPSAKRTSLPIEAVQRKLMYRSSQRGFRELDVLLGNFARMRVPDMTPEELDQLDSILDLETPDLFKILSQQSPPPPSLNRNMVLAEVINAIETRYGSITQVR